MTHAPPPQMTFFRWYNFHLAQKEERLKATQNQRAETTPQTPTSVYVYRPYEGQYYTPNVQQDVRGPAEWRAHTRDSATRPGVSASYQSAKLSGIPFRPQSARRRPASASPRVGARSGARTPQPPQDFVVVHCDLSEEVGMSLSEQDRQVIVADVVEGTQASTHGVRPGWRLLQIAGTDVIQNEDVARLMAGCKARAEMRVAFIFSREQLPQRPVTVPSGYASTAQNPVPNIPASHQELETPKREEPWSEGARLMTMARLYGTTEGRRRAVASPMVTTRRRETFSMLRSPPHALFAGLPWS